MKGIFQSNNKSCYACGSNTTYRRPSDGNINWYNNEPTKLHLCQKCYSKYINNPGRNRRSQTKNSHRILFKDRRIVLWYNPRTGICSNCNNKSNRTNIHHKEYYTIFKWFATTELCTKCHIIESKRLGQIISNTRK